MVGIMVVMETSFKRTDAIPVWFPVLLYLVPLNPQQATVDPYFLLRLLDTQASLAQSPMGSLLLSPGSWNIHGLVCALQESVSKSCGISVIKFQ